MARIYIAGLLLLLGFGLQGQSKPKRVVHLGQELREISGMVWMGRDSIWAINDSGNEPILYLLGEKGRVRRAIPLPVQNVDWEELCTDGKGNLFIGDFGNNANTRHQFNIYRYAIGSGALDSIQFTYNDYFKTKVGARHAFDMEAMVWINDSLHLFSKSMFSGNFFTKHYVLPARSGAQRAMLQDSFLCAGRAISGACYDAKSQRLFLIGYYFGKKWGFLPKTKATIYVFEKAGGRQIFKGKHRKIKAPRCIWARQYESLALADPNWLVLANERLLWQKQSIRRRKLK